MDSKFYELPEELWQRVEPLLPVGPGGGRPRFSDRVILAAVMYRLRTGYQWKALPAQFGSGSTCHLRFQQWVAAGVFERIFAHLVQFYDARRGIQWTWTALDSAIVKAPKEGTIRAPIRPIARNPA